MMMAALTKSAHPGPFLISQAGAGGRQVTRAAAESPEAAAGEDEGSTGSSLGRRDRGLGRKRKAATGDAAAPLPGMRQRGGASAALTGDEGRAAGSPSAAYQECDSNDFRVCLSLAAAGISHPQRFCASDALRRIPHSHCFTRLSHNKAVTSEESRG